MTMSTEKKPLWASAGNAVETAQGTGEPVVERFAAFC
jgi:hypothetical protein